MKEAAPAPRRLVSLDVLRGFDMFWILGADQLMTALARCAPAGPLGALGRQFEHSAWAGLTAYDLVFPLFLFIAGVSVALAQPNQIARHGRRAVVFAIARRTALLIALGILYNGGWARGWDGVRWVGVLQRIGFAYGVTATLACFVRPRHLVAVVVMLLAGYAALLAWVPIRAIQLEPAALAARAGGKPPDPAEVRTMFAQETGRVTGRYEPGLNVAHHFDFQYLPGSRYRAYWDPEGLLSSIPAVASCVLGLLAGLIFRCDDLGAAQRLARLLALGAGLLLAGWLWSGWQPVIKDLWTPSFTLVTGGAGALLLAGFYYLVDVRGWERVSAPFVWIGMNSITLYLAVNLINFRQIAARLVGPDLQRSLDEHLVVGAGRVALVAVSLSLVVLLARFLFRSRIFLRL